MKSILQSQQGYKFDTLCLTHVVVVVSGFRYECFLPNSFFPFSRKAERGWKWREKYRWPAKNAKVNVKHRFFLINKRSVKYCLQVREKSGKSQGILNFLMSCFPVNVCLLIPCFYKLLRHRNQWSSPKIVHLCQVVISCCSIDMIFTTKLYIQDAVGAYIWAWSYYGYDSLNMPYCS